MARKFARLILALGVLGLTFGPRPAAGQSLLERLESQIRRQSGQPSDGTKAGQSAAVAPARQGQPPVLPAPPTLPPPPAPMPDAGPLPSPPQTGAVVAAATPAAADRPYLGMFADDRQDKGHGVRVLQVYPDGPSAKAGLQSQDLITGMAAMPVRQMSELADILDLYKPGDKIALQVLRNGQPQKLEITLGSHQTVVAMPQSAEPPRLTLPGSPSTSAPASTFRTAPYATTPTPPSPYPSTPTPGVPGLLPSAPNFGATAADSERVTSLERRVAELEHRVGELEHLLREKAKTEPPPRPRLFNRPAPRPPEQ